MEDNTQGKEFIQRLLLGQMGLDELWNHLTANPFPRTVTLVANNACNLRCAHCYLQVKELTSSALTEREWKLFIDSIAQTDMELVCLSGKEVFLGNMGSGLLSYLREAKDREEASYRIGLITNGTLVHRHTDTISRAKPNYFDISIDGIESDHDAVRGKGAFALAFPNVEWAAKAFGEQFFVSLTVQKQNFTRLTEAVDFLHQHNVQNISCGIYRPLSYTAQNLALEEKDIDLVIDHLSELESISLQHPLSVLFEFDIINLQSLKAFLRSKWFSLDSIQQDINGEYYIAQVLKNGIRLEFRFATFPTGIWRSVRITPEGNYLASEDTIDTTLYAERVIGNVRDFDYNFTALQAHALASERFREIVTEYYNDILPDLIAACRRHHVVSVAA